jgi:hypothetical protein
MDIMFAPNYTHLYEIDVTPSAATPTWARVGRGIATIEPDGNEEVDQTGYYDGDGGTSSEVTGGQMILSLTGHRCYGDPFQDYVASLAFIYGQARHTHVRVTNPDGEVVTDDVTLANIKAFGANGDANNKGDFEVEVHFNGSPTVEQAPTGETLPESVSAKAVSVKAGETAAIVATVTPTTASQRCVYAVDDEKVATVDVDGTVTGVAAGDTKVYVKCAAKPSVQATVVVTVTA